MYFKENWIKFKKWNERRKFNFVVADRHFLSDYESDLFIPEMKARAEVLSQYVDFIIERLDEVKGDPAFVAAFSRVVNPNQIAPTNPMLNPQQASDKYCDDLREQLTKSYIEPISTMLDKYSEIKTLKNLGAFLTELNLICSSITQIKEKWLMYRINSFPYAVNAQTGHVILNEPTELMLIFTPFKGQVENIYGVAKSTADNLLHWHKQHQESKKELVGLFSKKYAFNLQIIAIIFTFTLSAFFMIASDPFNQFKVNFNLKKNISDLKSSLNTLEFENVRLKINLNDSIKKENAYAKDIQDLSGILKTNKKAFIEYKKQMESKILSLKERLKDKNEQE